MIASVLKLDRKAMKVLQITDLYSIHKTIYSLYPGNKREFLFYDQGGDIRSRSILILSKVPPLLPAAGEVTSKRIPDEFLEDHTYAFRVQLNPIVRLAGSRRVKPVVGKEPLLSWFLRNQEQWGFSADKDRLEVSDTGVTEIRKTDHIITLNRAEFTGMAVVGDRNKFRKSFEEGIGRAKAFGFGLLQIMPMNTYNK